MAKKHLKLTLGILISVLFVGLSALPAQAGSPDGVDGVVEANNPVCPIRFQLRFPDRCRAQGERAEINELASKGLLPQRPLPLVRLDESLGDLPFYYVQSKRKDGTPLYTSLQDALKGQNEYRVIEHALQPRIARYESVSQLKHPSSRIIIKENAKISMSPSGRSEMRSTSTHQSSPSAE
ncbi:hypothetical protein ES705_46417 [subsurface metagenome]